MPEIKVNTDILNQRWRALAGPPEDARVVVEGHEQIGAPTLDSQGKGE